MEYAVLLTKQPDNGYIARSLLLPDIVVSGVNEAEALTQMRIALSDVHRQSRVVQISIPTPDETETNPWLRVAGVFANDPTWDEFQAEIAANRRLIDAQDH
jgi:predicted RNase H-like HicB family nuclease